MSVSATVTWKSFNVKFTSKNDFSIWYFMLSLLMVTSASFSWKNPFYDTPINSTTLNIPLIYIYLGENDCKKLPDD